MMGLLDRWMARVLSVARVLPAGRVLSVGVALVVTGTVSESLSTAGPNSVWAADHARARQILQDKCLSCHSGDTVRGGLDLGSREQLLAGGDTGEVIDLENRAQSRLLQLIQHRAEPAMPFKQPKLTDAEIDALSAWILEGAPYDGPLEAPQWWSLRPLELPAVPAIPVALQAWTRNAVDQFIAARWPDRELGPAPEADRRTLLRRLYFDLIGLPPTPEAVDAFLADRSPDAYERVVDQLLNSPHYGERWARYWMDLAHYAETHGHDQDRVRPNAWPYRDYLIRSFNTDKPYARFVQEQIAGDVLWPDDPEGCVAMGFLAAGPWDESSLRDIRDDTLDRQIARYLDRDDMLTTAMSTFVSTTVHCARCHDHKFDPVSQVDYYRLQAVFAGIDKGERPYDLDPRVARRRRETTALLARLPDMERSQSAELLTDSRQQLTAAWEAQFRSQVIPWHVVTPNSAVSEQGATLAAQPDGSFLATGSKPETDVYVFQFAVQMPRVTGLRLEALVDESLAHQGPGRQDNGNLHLNEVSVMVAPATDPGALRPVRLVRPQADFNQQGWSIDMAVDGNPATAWGIYPEVGKSHLAVFEFEEPVECAAGVMLSVRLEQSHGASHLIGRPRLAVTNLPGPLPLQAETLPPEIAEVLSIEPQQRDAGQQARLAAFVWKQELIRELDRLPLPTFVYSASNQFKPDGSFVPSPVPRVIQVLKRGDIRHPGDEVTPGTLTCIDGLSGDLAATLEDLSQEGPRRAALARWLTAEANVLTWRSIVNRVWQRHFGRGLVDTPSDFGRMGSTPTHPELLDWLAVTFRDGGGSLKALDRLLVTSATYRQSSLHRADYAERDSDARYLWRMPRTRLDAESLRDAVLQFAGQLDLQMAGPSAQQFNLIQGMHVTPTIDYLNFDVDSPASHRRSVYRFIFRTLPDPFMETLDCADSSQLTPVRNTSVTALQALATLNNRLIVRQSEHLAARLQAQSTDSAEQISQLYRIVLCRSPREQELRSVQKYVAQYGLANACRILLNCNEFLFID